MRRILAVAVTLAIAACSGAGAATLFFYGPDGALVPVERNVSGAQAAIGALVQGPTAIETNEGVFSAIPSGTYAKSIVINGTSVSIDLSRDAVAGLDEVTLTNIFRQVEATLRQFALGQDVNITSGGQALYTYLPPVTPVTPRARPVLLGSTTGALVGKSVTLSPGHGIYWNGTVWTTQRPVYCSPLNQEDFHNLEICQYLQTYLEQDGMTVIPVRCMDKSYGNHSSGNPWWEMAAYLWLQHEGYPCSVYASSTGDCNTGTGGGEVNDDIRSRPLASDYDNTNIFVSLHTNGLSGYCVGPGCPTGTVTYYDAGSAHAAWGAASQTLAADINPAVVGAIQANVDSTWSCNSGCTSNSNGAYGEIRIPHRPATLTELAYHDTCDRDADASHLRDNYFRSVAMWGMYQGICNYFGVTPTWGVRSCEVVSSDFPAVVKGGSTWTSHVTLRNRGCVWSSAHLFRLGAAGNSDPFAYSLRSVFSGEVGPGQTVTFPIAMRAPLTDATYVTDWQMVQDEKSAWFGPIVSQSVTVDSTPPTSPAWVNDGGPYSSSTTQITASWGASTDSGSGVNHYDYSVADSTGAQVLGWTSAGLSTSVTIPVSMVKGRKYFVSIRAVDNVGWPGAATSSTGVVAEPDAMTIPAAKALPSGTYVSLAGKVLTAVFPDRTYVQEPDRSSGIRIEAVTSTAPGSLVNVLGKMDTVDAERALSEAQISGPSGNPGLPVALSLSNFALGGASFSTLAPGVVNGSGLNNLGLWVRVYGTVTATSASGFRINDGSLADDGSGSPGVWVDSGSFHKPDAGAFALVTGISTTQPGTAIREVKVAQDSDIFP